jgi:hypothetical protein
MEDGREIEPRGDQMRTRLAWVATLSLVTVGIGSAAGMARADSSLNGGSAGNGEFVIGNGPGNSNATPGNDVMFWGAQWWMDNPLLAAGAATGTQAPASFKGFATSIEVSDSCGTFSSSPGNSSNPPATLPLNPDGTINVLVTDNVSKQGSVITGDVVGTATVLPDPGYAGDPGHAGTGVVESFQPCVVPSL